MTIGEHERRLPEQSFGEVAANVALAVSMEMSICADYERLQGRDRPASGCRPVGHIACRDSQAAHPFLPVNFQTARAPSLVLSRNAVFSVLNEALIEFFRLPELRRRFRSHFHIFLLGL